MKIVDFVFFSPSFKCPVYPSRYNHAFRWQVGYSNHLRAHPEIAKIDWLYLLKYTQK